MISSVFNGGVLYKTQVTRCVSKSEFNRTHEFKPKVMGRINIQQKHIDRIKKALTGVVNERHGTATVTRFKHITVAGKTGTAQVVALKKDQGHSNSEDDTPMEHRDHAWFVAVAPVEDPKIAMAILVEHGGHGGSTAAPIAREMIKTFFMGEDSGVDSKHSEN